MESYTIQFKKYTFTENLLKITEKQFLDKKNKDWLNSWVTGDKWMISRGLPTM
jgi:hypothetical protein